MFEAGILRNIARWCNLNTHCIICRQSSERLICHYCEDDLHRFADSQACPNLMHNAHIRNGLGKVSFPILRAFGPYQWPLSDVITHLKFAQKVSYAKALGQLFSQHIAVNLPHPVDVIVPVPLSRRRYASRLFNQSIEIAKHIKASQADHHAAVMQVRHDAIVRNKHTQAQTNLTAYQRQQNVKGAFSIDALIQARRIAIFDDVITTGATTEAVYQLLKRTYPDTEIEVWSMCITLAR